MLLSFREGSGPDAQAASISPEPFVLPVGPPGHFRFMLARRGVSALRCLTKSNSFSKGQRSCWTSFVAVLKAEQLIDKYDALFREAGYLESFIVLTTDFTRQPRPLGVYA